MFPVTRMQPSGYPRYAIRRTIAGEDSTSDSPAAPAVPGRLADFAEHDVTLAGAWTDYFGQRRFLGALRAAAPICAVSFVASGDGYWYVKSGRSRTAEVDIDLVISPVYEGQRHQIHLRIGSGINGRGLLPEARPIDIAETVRFQTGRLVDWARADRHGSPIRLLVFADEDLRSRRNGIWGVKRRYLEQLPAPWLDILDKTRQGHVAL